MGLKNAFNIQKVYSKKKKSTFLVKKFKNTFKGPTSPKMAKNHFWQKLENEDFSFS